MQPSVSLALRLPPGLLPTVSDLGPSDSSSEGLSDDPHTSIAGHRRSQFGRRSGPSAAGGRSAPAPAPVATSGPRVDADASSSSVGSARAGEGGSVQPPAQPGPEVQRVGSRRGPSRDGHAPTAPAASSGTFDSLPSSISGKDAPSASSSGMRAVDSTRAAAAAAGPLVSSAAGYAPAPTSSGSSLRSSTISGRSRSSSAGESSDGVNSWPSSPGSSIVGAQPASPPADTAPPPPNAAPATAKRSTALAAPGPSRAGAQAQGKVGRLAQPATAPPPPRRPQSPASSGPSSRASSRLGGYMVSTTAAEAKRNRPGSAGSVRSYATSAAAGSRPGSASPQKTPARPCSGRPGVEARVSRQMQRDPADWTVAEVCDWLEVIGLGQYRRRFVHHAVTGTVLLKLSNEELKVEVGIGPLGHREGLLTAVNDLEQHWQQVQAEQQEQQHSAARPGGSRSASPAPGAGPDYSLQRVYAQRAKLLRELEKAEGRQAHRSKAAEQALRVVGQASGEVRKLQASVCELDRQLGFQAAASQLYDPTDVHGAVAWQPAGTLRAAPRRPDSASPLRARSASPGGGSPMSAVSRRIMEAHTASGGGSFLERLSRDVAERQAKKAEAAKYAGRAAEAMHAEREREARHVDFLRELVEASHSGLAELLGSGDPAQVAEACDDLADSFQAELQLEEDVVTAVKRLGSPGKKAARLAGAVRSAQFMQRLQQDLATRESRVQELQQRYFKLEKGNTLEQQEHADLAAARTHFCLLGWPDADLDVAPEDATAACDAPLAAVLRRVVALQEARHRGKPPPDWEGPEWRRDGLADLQAEHNAKLQLAWERQQAAEREEAAALAAGRRSAPRQAGRRHAEVPKPGDRLGATVQLLAECRPGEVALLEGLTGTRKLLMCWRAVRAQQFIAFTRRDLEARQAKARHLEAQLYPDNTKVLPKDEFEKFFDRLMADTQRRVANRDELAEKARAEALAKLMRSAPPPPSHRRQRPASAAS